LRTTVDTIVVKNSNLLNTCGVLTQSGTVQRRVSAPSEHP
jgi:hypothetical protein